MKHWFITILTLSCFLSCGDEGSVLSEEGDGQTIVKEITVAKGTRADDTTDEEILTSNTFGEKSILYVSQLGNEMETNFKPGFPITDTPEEILENLYPYEWYDNPNNPTWDNDEYNFKAINPANVINWNTIKRNGSVGNAFWLYAMYFPEDQKIKFNVAENQTNISDFKKSDIMGAYHATSSLYSPLRFRLFHLMVYLKVTLYVPVYSSYNSGNESGYSGFTEDALQDVYVMNANTDFKIEWRANRSSDTEAPLTQPDGAKKNIFMYRHKDKADEDQTQCLDVSNYYTGNFIGVCKCKKEESVPCDDCQCECCKEGGNPSACKCDEVRVYNFSVLFPAQSFGVKDKILCFPLNLPDTDGNIKYYYFSSSQIIGGTNENYSLTQGTLQHLHLYLPRTTNETILIGAKILPWKDAFTDMTVTEQTEQD